MNIILKDMGKTLLQILDLTNEPDIITQIIDKMIKRFKVTDPSGRTETKRYDTIKEVIEDLKSSKRDLSLQRYYVECLVDEIEIEADELLKAWDEGERPGDLQMF